jgi:hypothetical protein
MFWLLWLLKFPVRRELSFNQIKSVDLSGLTFLQEL